MHPFAYQDLCTDLFIHTKKIISTCTENFLMLPNWTNQPNKQTNQNQNAKHTQIS